MKQNINEEVARMREMMGLEEQLLNKLKTAWNDKVKPAAEKAGQAIQTGVHNVAQKVADVTQKPQEPQQTNQPAQNQSTEEKQSDIYKKIVQTYGNQQNNLNIGYGVAQSTEKKDGYGGSGTDAMNQAKRNAEDDYIQKNTKKTTNGNVTTGVLNVTGAFTVLQEATYGIKQNDGSTIWYSVCVVEFEKK